MVEVTTVVGTLFVEQDVVDALIANGQVYKSLPLESQLIEWASRVLAKAAADISPGADDGSAGFTDKPEDWSWGRKEPAND